jgi:hypothetical protein
MLDRLPQAVSDRKYTLPTHWGTFPQFMLQQQHTCLFTPQHRLVPLLRDANADTFSDAGHSGRNVYGPMVRRARR